MHVAATITEVFITRLADTSFYRNAVVRSSTLSVTNLLLLRGFIYVKSLNHNSRFVRTFLN